MDEEEVRNEEVRDSISRRRIIKRASVGAAVVWSAPVLTSLATPAYAQDGGRTPAGQPCGPNAPDWECGDPIVECGVPADSGPCVCDQDVEGNDFCWNNFFCGTFDPCTESSECPGSQRCVTSCCGQTCAPACGAQPLSSSSSGKTAAGV
jgi:hypothetical protein